MPITDIPNNYKKKYNCCDNREKLEEAIAILEELVNNSTGYISAIEIDQYNGVNLKAEEWYKKAKEFIRREK